jgi:hypothetical protein
MYEKTLATLPGTTSFTRIDLVQIARPGEQPTLELRHMSDAGELGWCVHKRITLAPGSIPDLRQALNLMDPDAQAPAPATARAPHLQLVDDIGDVG